MRRLDDGHAQRPPPFRVLAVPDGNYLSPTAIPPPPRAPEPYKIAPSTTSSSRAHRRSSFVIIADSRPASPEIRSPSPTLATGRVSPFRGRGFKGPPPRSKSRPQSPENGGTRRRGRSERRVSVSQQNSPRRSLIPQPTRQRSTSLSKSTDRLNSPKLGRRADSRVRLNITDSRNRLNASGNNNSTVNLSNRRQVSRTPSKLSPIQGTPTKPERTPQVRRKDGSKESAKSSLNKDSSTSSSRNAWNAKKQSQERISGVGNGSSKERLTSPSKIPLKTNRVSSNSLNPPRFITVSDQSNEKGKKVIDKGSKKEVRVYDEKSNGSGQSGKRSDTNDKGSSNDRATDLNLIDLLKRTSGATGTSSVVNTTATTAVQPLHIDANAILVEKGDSDKRNHTERTKSQQDLSNGKSSNSLHDDSANKPMQTSQSISGEERRQINNQATKSTKTNAAGNQNKVKSGLESRNDSSASLEKNNTGSQSNKVTSKATKNTGTQRSNKNQNGAIDHGTTKFATNDNKISEESSALQTASASNPSKINENDLINDSTKSVDGQRRINSNASVSVKQEDSKTSSKSVNESETKTNTNVSTVIANNTVPSQTKTVSKTNSVSSAVGVVSNDSKSKVNSGGVKTRTNNHGSGTSLKSSAGASVDSIESVRSTDTGVSVDTVKGVSSPREKTGMHVVKRSQEIETLSGNIVHLEQNGEPAALAATNGVGERGSVKLLTRWRKSLGRCCDCWPSMRCLVCRTDRKGLAWPGKQARSAALVTEDPSPTDNVPTGCWTKFKNRCRCKRLRELKCCSKRSRIAPAEASVCCPPERRFGAICRRLFDRCKCRRNSDTERTRNIRAKHSLTSVAPPPLSEEPKAKIPDVLVEHNSLMRGAIPCLPVPLAWFCLVWNVLLPGSGTVWSGIFNLCTGQPRFSPVAGLKSRLGAFVVNLIVGVGQLFTVLFCLVGWGWSIWWGVTLVRLARKYKRFKASEAANNDPEARGGEQTALPPGVPSQALRGMERTR